MLAAYIWWPLNMASCDYLLVETNGFCRVSTGEAKTLGMIQTYQLVAQATRSAVANCNVISIGKTKQFFSHRDVSVIIHSTRINCLQSYKHVNPTFYTGKNVPITRIVNPSSHCFSNIANQYYM